MTISESNHNYTIYFFFSFGPQFSVLRREIDRGGVEGCRKAISEDKASSHPC
jgi:hypothetical protein